MQTSNTPMTAQALRDIASELKKTMQCNCDLDNWEPEHDTGHSWVCRIHKEAKREHARRLAGEGGGK